MCVCCRYTTSYAGNSGNSWGYHSGRQFTTYDADHDSWGNNCANPSYWGGGGFWYGACWTTNIFSSSYIYHGGSYSSLMLGLREYRSY